MKFGSDISILIHSMNEKQREEFSNFINRLKIEGLDDKLGEFTCDEIIESIASTTEYERKKKESQLAVDKGTTTIPKEKWGVHITHCCLEHGCKYGHIDCPVATGLVKQKYLCEDCAETSQSIQN